MNTNNKVLLKKRIINKVQNLLCSDISIADITDTFLSLASQYKSLIDGQAIDVFCTHAPMLVNNTKIMFKGCMTDVGFHDFLRECNIEYNWIEQRENHLLTFENILELKVNNEKSYYYPIVLHQMDNCEDPDCFAMLDIKSDNIEDLINGNWVKK